MPRARCARRRPRRPRRRRQREPVKTARTRADRVEPAAGADSARRRRCRARGRAAPLDLGLSDEEARDLALIIELSQQRAPAAFARGDGGAPDARGARGAVGGVRGAPARGVGPSRSHARGPGAALLGARGGARVLPSELHVRAGTRGVPSGSERSDAARLDPRRSRRSRSGFRRARLRRAARARSSSRSPSTSTGTIARSPRRCGPDAAPVRFAAAWPGRLSAAA